MQRQRVTVLGSTGSVGKNTLDVIARHPENFEIFALSANTNADEMLAQCLRFKPQCVVMCDATSRQKLAKELKQNNLKTEIFSSPNSLEDIASHDQVNIVMAAIVGAAGLYPSLAAAKAGKRLLLANKEALVVGGRLFMDTVTKGRATLLPIDSEHSAIFQSLPHDRLTWNERVEKIILTASGGPFRSRDLTSFYKITPAEAVMHPNWEMGRKISVDSATMMNKALEVIEAHYLFDMPPEKIEVVIHPQSIIHSMVQYKDTSVIAQLGNTDMRVPIAYGFGYPERIESGAEPLNWRKMSAMTFEPVDETRFPSVQLAWEAMHATQGTTAVLNAANEIAVDAFLNHRIRFDQIHAVNAEVLSSLLPTSPQNLDDLIAIDEASRAAATQFISKLKGAASC